MRFSRASSSGALARAARFVPAASLVLALAAPSRAGQPIVEDYPDPPASMRGDSIEGPPNLIERDLSGPRFGFTVRPDESVGHHDVGRVVSQFGWHFEHHISAIEGGPQFVTEFVPLVAGVEYGKLLPSASLGIGVRFPTGYEFGLGPTASVWRGPLGVAEVKSALFFAVGRTFDYSGVHVPVNLVWATNQDGNRVTLIAGYAIRRASRRIAS